MISIELERNLLHQFISSIDNDDQNLDHYHVFRKCDLIRKDYSDYR